MHKKLIIALNIISIIALSLLMASSVYAWFYFPSSKNLIINTAPNLDVDIELYHLEANAETESYEFHSVEAVDNTLSVDSNLVFFHWGGEYICESNKDDYYAIIATYDSDSYSNKGNLAAIINSSIICTSEYYIGENDETNLRFPIVSLAYSIASSNELDLSTVQATTEIRNASYTSISLTGEDDQNDPSFIVNGNTSKPLSELNSTQYKETYTGEDSQINSRIKVIIFLRVTADEARVNSAMESIEGFGNELSIQLYNKVVVTIDYRSIPSHTLD